MLMFWDGMHQTNNFTNSCRVNQFFLVCLHSMLGRNVRAGKKTYANGTIRTNEVYPLKNLNFSEPSRHIPESTRKT